MTYDEIFTQEIQREREMIKRIRELDGLDDLSKEMIRLRLYQSQKEHIYLNELEQA